MMAYLISLWGGALSGGFAVANAKKSLPYMRNYGFNGRGASGVAKAKRDAQKRKNKLRGK